MSMNRTEFDGFLPVLGALSEHWRAVEYCLEKRWLLPTLTLTYSMIDAMSWLAAPASPQSVQDRFVAWVEKWLLVRGEFDVSALDLYAARCAIVHTMTSDSNLSGKGKAKRVLYCIERSDLAAL